MSGKDKVNGLLFGLLAIIATLCSAGTARAVALVNVDFDGYHQASPPPMATYSGPGAVGSAGDLWNGIPYKQLSANSLSASNLKKSGGSITSVGLQVEGVNTGTVPGTLIGGYNDGSAHALFRDCIWAITEVSGYADQLRFSLSGLSPERTYDLYFYSQVPANNDGADFTIGGVTKTATGTGTTTAYIDGQTYVKFSGVSPSGGGRIDGTVEQNPSDASATFSGLQVEGFLPGLIMHRVNVDFDGYHQATDPTVLHSGPAAVGEAGDIWNEINYKINTAPSVSASDLVDSSGNSTSLDLLVEASDGDNIGGACYASANALFLDALFAVAGNATYAESLVFTLSRLDPKRHYDLYLYSENYYDDGADFTIGGVTKNASGDGNTDAYIDGHTYVKFLGLSPNASGQIIGLVEQPSGDGSATFSGLQLEWAVTIPEPSTFALLGIGLIGLLGFTRRRERV